MLKTILEELPDYLWAFTDKWLFWIGIVILIGDLLEKFVPAIKKKLEKWAPRWVLGSLAILCLFIATFQVWHEEREMKEAADHKSEMTEHKFEVMTKPQFEVEAVAVVSTGVLSEHGKRAGFGRLGLRIFRSKLLWVMRPYPQHLHCFKNGVLRQSPREAGVPVLYSSDFHRVQIQKL